MASNTPNISTASLGVSSERNPESIPALPLSAILRSPRQHLMSLAIKMKVAGLFAGLHSLAINSVPIFTCNYNDQRSFHLFVGFGVVSLAVYKVEDPLVEKEKSKHQSVPQKRRRIRQQQLQRKSLARLPRQQVMLKIVARNVSATTASKPTTGGGAARLQNPAVHGRHAVWRMDRRLQGLGRKRTNPL